MPSPVAQSENGGGNAFFACLDRTSGGISQEMRRLLLFLAIPFLFFLHGCATDESGRKLGPWQTLQRWDDSMNTTESRLANKSY